MEGWRRYTGNRYKGPERHLESEARVVRVDRQAAWEGIFAR